MASLSFTKIFILFLITLLFSISNADFSPPYKLVDKVCNKLEDTDVCFQILESDDRSKFAENITILTTIAVNQTIRHANALRNELRELKTGSPVDNVKRCQRIVDSNGAHGSFMTTGNSVTVDLYLDFFRFLHSNNMNISGTDLDS
ncbi:unnamed protein product [Lactuca virosa]|uniref:Pectinesterase inhibitor domain-containing protein n=1 Tax=Lactuca virosa TaxID=75947 RepID=A0AAU9MV45_9ASTR|nr:unnamed protein product [Lactuca virosa]